MASWNRRPIVPVVVLSVAVTAGVACPAWAGPHLARTTEYSSAGSIQECGRQVSRVLARLQKEGHVSRTDGDFASNASSTAAVECVLVGRSQQREQQFIFYIVVASDDANKGRDLRELLRKRLGRIERID
jgi:hypothetical protein